MPCLFEFSFAPRRSTLCMDRHLWGGPLSLADPTCWIRQAGRVPRKLRPNWFHWILELLRSILRAWEFCYLCSPPFGDDHSDWRHPTLPRPGLRDGDGSL